METGNAVEEGFAFCIGKFGRRASPSTRTCLLPMLIVAPVDEACWTLVG